MHLHNLVAQAVARQAGERVLEHACVHRANRLQLGGARLELGGLLIDALEHLTHLGAALAAQAAQLERLLGELAAPVGKHAAHLRAHPGNAVDHDTGEHLAAPWQQLVGERRLQPEHPARFERDGVTCNARGQGLASRQRENAPGFNAEPSRRLGHLPLDLGLDLR